MLTISRTLLSLSDLVIPDTLSGASGIWLSAYTVPASAADNTLATSSRWVNYDLPVATRRVYSPWSVTVGIADTSRGNVYAQVDVLEAAVGQFAFTMVDDVTGKTWSLYGGDLTPPDTVDPADGGGFATTVTLSLPVQGVS